MPWVPFLAFKYIVLIHYDLLVHYNLKESCKAVFPLMKMPQVQNGLPVSNNVQEVYKYSVLRSDESYVDTSNSSVAGLLL